MNEDSIFTKIINGEIPSHKIYEDDKTIAFLDIYPAVKGQTVVTTKNQVEFVWDLPEEDYSALMKATKIVARQLREKLGVSFVGTKIVGIDVPHAHVVVCPFNTVAEYNAPQDMSAEPDHAALATLAAKLKFKELD